MPKKLVPHLLIYIALTSYLSLQASSSVQPPKLTVLVADLEEQAVQNLIAAIRKLHEQPINIIPQDASDKNLKDIPAFSMQRNKPIRKRATPKERTLYRSLQWVDNKRICCYCNQIYNRTAIQRHIQKYCPLRPLIP